MFILDEAIDWNISSHCTVIQVYVGNIEIILAKNIINIINNIK